MRPAGRLSRLLFGRRDCIMQAMPSIYDLKPRFQTLLRPLIAKLAARGCTPNLVTLLALLLSLIVGAAVLCWPKRHAVLLLRVHLDTTTRSGTQPKLVPVIVSTRLV